MELERSLGRDRGAAGEKDGQVGTYLKLRDGDRQAKRQKLSSEQRCMETEPELHQRHRETRQRRPGDGGAVQSQVSFYEDHSEEPNHQKEAETQNTSQRWLPGDQGWSLLCRHQPLE